MPALIPLLGVIIASLIGGIVARILLALGMGIVSFVGVTHMANQLVQRIHDNVGGIPSDVLSILGLAGFDVFLSLVISANVGSITFFFAASGYSRLSFLNKEGG